jgi:hypothetical protein
MVGKRIVRFPLCGIHWERTVKDEYTMRGFMYAGRRRYRCRTDGSLPKAYESS